MKEHGLDVQNIFHRKSLIHRAKNSAKPIQTNTDRSNWLGCLAGGFYYHRSSISNKVFSEPLMHALSQSEGPIEIIFNFI